MTNVIHDYPKSSCTCYKCNEDEFVIPKGVSTNMSVPGCHFSPYYDCFSKRIFKVQQEPSPAYGQTLLNPAVVSNDKFAQNYTAIDVKDCPRSSCNGTTYLNSDPRLYNAAGPTWLQLDRPPLVSTPKLNTLTNNKSLDYYGQNYSSYADVNAGQVLYYISKDREDAFYEPLFAEKATAVGTMYQDPMGNMKPQYDRVPDEKYDPILQDPCDVTGDYCLSWIRDSQFQREDLLARQMRRRNQERFAPRWTNIKQ